MIAKQNLKHGAYYTGHCRNATEARWDNNRQVFLYRRHKFGYTFIEELPHPDDEQHYDVFVPEQILENPKEEIKLY